MTPGRLPLRLSTARTCYLHAAIASSLMTTFGYGRWFRERMLATRAWYDDHGGAYTDFPLQGEYRRVLDEELFRPEDLPDRESLTTLIGDSVRSERYVTILLDRSQLGPFFGRQRSSFRHEILVFGFHPEANLVDAVDFDGMGRLARCQYRLDDVATAAQDVEALGPTGDEPKYVVQVLSRGRAPESPNIGSAVAAIRSFAEGAEVHVGPEKLIAEWWQPAYLHPVPGASYLYGCDAIDPRIGLDDVFCSADKHLQNVQLIQEQALACRNIIAEYIGSDSCSWIAAHNEVLREIWAFKVAVMAHRLRGVLLQCRPTPVHWRTVVRRSCEHFLEIVDSIDRDEYATFRASHAARCPDRKEIL